MSVVKKRSVTIRGHQTSFSLEQPFYDIVCAMAKTADAPLARFIAELDAARPRGTNLSSALRLAALDWAKNQSRSDGHEPALTAAAVASATD